ncbi:MAG: alpha/beta hydrolase [Wenzhouxiangellaceae bacterium]
MTSFDDQIEQAYAQFKTPASRVNTPLRLARLYLRLLSLAAPAKAAKTAHKWFFTPLKSPMSAKDTAVIEQAANRQTLTLDNGVAFESYCWGEGERCILLVHGWESKAAHFKILIDKLLARGYRVAAFDAPGHGLSAGNWSDILEYIKIIFAMEREYGPFYGAVGHSLGGLALTNAVKRGLQLQRAVVISAPTKFRAVIDKYAKIIDLNRKMQLRLRESVKGYFGLGDELWNTFTAYKGLDQVQIAATIFHDEQDDEVLYVEGQCLAQAWPGATLVTTQGLGHRKIIKSDDVTEQIVTCMD